MDNTALGVAQEGQVEYEKLQDNHGLLGPGKAVVGNPHSPEQFEAYTCGSCRSVYNSIGDLHAHIHKHGLGGSYHYDHRCKTAFPKYDSICSETQTDSKTKVKNSQKKITSPKTIKLKRSSRLSRKEKMDYDEDTLLTAPMEGDSTSSLHQSQAEKANEPEIAHESEKPDESRINFDSEKPDDSEIADELETRIIDNEVATCNESETAYESDEPRKTKKALRKRRAVKRKYKMRQTRGSEDETKLEDTLRYTCHTCKLVFCSEEFLTTHKKKHAGVMLCDCCGEIFTSLDQLESHVLHGTGKLINAVEMYVCSVCDMSATELSGLKAHLCALKSRSSVMSKDTCAPKKQAVRMYTNNATEKHGRSKLIPITECSGDKQEMKVQCGTCCLWFENDYFRVMHSVVHKYTAKCNKCNLYFTNEADRDLHSANCVHSAWKHVCTICGKRCQCKATLIAHEETHKNVKDLICEMCGKAFKTHNSVRIHVKERCPMLANRVRKFSCDLCDNKFFEKYQMRLHLQTVHSDIRPFVCEICARAFKTKDMLKHHFKIHKDRPTLTCEICNATFKDPGALRRHRKLHLQHKKWSCEFCGKQFNEKWNMKAHTRTHTGDKPYKCDWCGQGFTHNVSRKAHMEKCGGRRDDNTTLSAQPSRLVDVGFAAAVSRSKPNIHKSAGAENRLFPNDASMAKSQSHMVKTDLVTQGHVQVQGHVQSQEQVQGHDQAQGHVQGQGFSHDNVNNKGHMDMCGQDFGHAVVNKAQRMVECEETRPENNPIFLPGYPSYNFPRVPGYPF